MSTYSAVKSQTSPSDSWAAISRAPAPSVISSDEDRRHMAPRGQELRPSNKYENDMLNRFEDLGIEPRAAELQGKMKLGVEKPGDQPVGLATNAYGLMAKKKTKFYRYEVKVTGERRSGKVVHFDRPPVDE